MKLVVLGLSITSSWGNGHATNYRALVRALAERGHDVLFLEREAPWYAANRDLPEPPWGRTELYGSVEELRDRWTEEVAAADAVVLGSYVPEGVDVGGWLLATARGPLAFWDIDTPVTVAKLDARDEEYVSRALVRRFDLYLSFTAGPLLARIERVFGARCAVPFHCMADPDLYCPVAADERWLLGYLGTYSTDRQPAVESLLLEPARRLADARFAVAGPQYPADVRWPGNVERVDHVPPAEHAGFYARQRFTLNVTRAAMVRAGWSPSVRLFEAAACATPVLSDRWSGLEAFFRPGTEILVVDGPDDVAAVLREVPPAEVRKLGERARERVLAEHTPARRAEQLEGLLASVLGVAA
jgi:spore maturation protein CgeB